MNGLERYIVKRIESGGPVSFRDFMELCLYHPEHGYYNSPGENIGRGGDYITSSIVSRVFGEMVARQIQEMWEHMGCGDFKILEVGAGQGFLAFDILEALKGTELFGSLEYLIVERSHEMVKRQKEELKDFQGKVKWFESMGEVKITWGCILTNELVDALPVYMVEMVGGGLQEVWVDYRDGKFVEVLRPARESLKDYFHKLGVKLEIGYRTEANLDAMDWISDVAGALEKGFFITIDYGYPSEELYKPYRAKGTLLCYYQHGAYENPYKRLGQQDITSHVNFSALVRSGREKDLEFTGFTDLAHFMMGLGLEEFMMNIEKEKGFEEYVKRMDVIKHFIMPESMGQIFKVLIQHKGIERPELMGFKYPPFGGLRIE